MSNRITQEQKGTLRRRWVKYFGEDKIDLALESAIYRAEKLMDRLEYWFNRLIKGVK